MNLFTIKRHLVPVKPQPRVPAIRIPAETASHRVIFEPGGVRRPANLPKL